MKELSPIDAIAPAFARVRSLLLPPAPVSGQRRRFSGSFFFRIVLVAALTSTGFYSGSIAMILEAVGFGAMVAGVGIVHSGTLVTSPGAVVLSAAVLVAGALVLAAWVFAAWLWSRLRFTLFELVVDGHGQVRLAWSHYAAQAWRYLGTSILLLLALLVLLAATAGPVVLHLLVLLKRIGPAAADADPSLLLAHILPIYGIVLPFGLLAALVDAVLLDFILPVMALEDAPIEQAAGRFFRLLRDHFGQVSVYLLLRLVLILGFTACGGVVVFLLLLLLGGAGAATGFMLFHLLWHGGSAGMALFVLYCVVGVCVVLAAYLLALICVHGLIGLFRNCFAVSYFAGHYPQLGNRLAALWAASAAVEPGFESSPTPPLARPPSAG